MEPVYAEVSMMSNSAMKNTINLRVCAGFWSSSGELLALYWTRTDLPMPRSVELESALNTQHEALGLRSGRWALLNAQYLNPQPAEPEEPGWIRTVPRMRRLSPPRKTQVSKEFRSDAPCTAPAPAMDVWALKVLPTKFEHEHFSFRSQATWIRTIEPELGEIPEGWYAVLDALTRQSFFIVRIVPRNGKLPSPGWRNILGWILRSRWGAKLVPLNSLPSITALQSAPAWEYRVEGGLQENRAAWDVQILPSRKLLSRWLGTEADPWEATALLRWVRPDLPGMETVNSQEQPLDWVRLFGFLPAADARLLVHNVLLTLPGGAATSATLFYETTETRIVTLEGLPMAYLSTLFPHRAWREVERARRHLPAAEIRAENRLEVFSLIDKALIEGRLSWSQETMDFWDAGYRQPRDQALGKELDQLRQSGIWEKILAGNPLVPDEALRRMDVTDAAICLRTVPDKRWRRHVTARREAELKEELAFLDILEHRGELLLERQWDAWNTFSNLISDLTNETPPN